MGLHIRKTILHQTKSSAISNWMIEISECLLIINEIDLKKIPNIKNQYGCLSKTRDSRRFATFTGNGKKLPENATNQSQSEKNSQHYGLETKSFESVEHDR